MKKILVTGGTGFLGSNLVLGLLKRGYNVRVFDNDFRGNYSRLSSVSSDIEFIQGDIRDYDAVEQATKGVDWVFHLAFVNGTKNFYESPQLVLDVGVKGAMTTMDAANKHNIEKYILASSSEVYQEPTHIPTTESERIIIPDVFNPRYSYSGGKIISELLAIHYLDNVSRRIIFRPHNIYGPDMGWEHVIPDFMRRIRLLKHNDPNQIHPFPIQGSGIETRAFCYVDDAVDGIILLSEEGADKDIYHLGMSDEIQIIELAKKISHCCGINLDIQSQPLLEGSTSKRCPDISKLTSLGYMPKINIDTGIAKSWDWYKDAILPSI